MRIALVIAMTLMWGGLSLAGPSVGPYFHHESQGFRQGCLLATANYADAKPSVMVIRKPSAAPSPLQSQPGETRYANFSVAYVTNAATSQREKIVVVSDYLYGHSEHDRLFTQAGYLSSDVQWVARGELEIVDGVIKRANNTSKRAFDRKERNSIEDVQLALAGTEFAAAEYVPYRSDDTCHFYEPFNHNPDPELRQHSTRTQVTNNSYKLKDIANQQIGLLDIERIPPDSSIYREHGDVLLKHWDILMNGFPPEQKNSYLPCQQALAKAVEGKTPLSRDDVVAIRDGLEKLDKAHQISEIRRLP